MWMLHGMPVTYFLCCSESSTIRVWAGSGEWLTIHPVLNLSDAYHQGLWELPRIYLGLFPSLRSLDCPRTCPAGIQGRVWHASQDGKERRSRMDSTGGWRRGWRGSLSSVFSRHSSRALYTRQCVLGLTSRTNNSGNLNSGSGYSHSPLWLSL